MKTREKLRDELTQKLPRYSPAPEQVNKAIEFLCGEIDRLNEELDALKGGQCT